MASPRRIYVLREWWTLHTDAGSWRTSPRTGTDSQRWKWYERSAENRKTRERKKRPVRLQGQRVDIFILLDRCCNSRWSASTRRRGKCFAAESALFIPPPGAPIKEGIRYEWKACGCWHLNTYWLNNHGLVGFVLKAFFLKAAFSGGKREAFTTVLSVGSCTLLCYYRSGFCACKGPLIKLCKAQNP